MSVKVVAFNTTTAAAGNTVVVTNLGFTPTGALLIWNNRVDTVDAVGQGNYSYGYGFVARPTDRRVAAGFSKNAVALTVTNQVQRDDACVATLLDTDAIDGLLDLQSFDADGATFVIDDAFSVSVRVIAIFFGGVPVATGEYVDPGAAGNFDYTALSFQPTLLLQMGTSTSATTVVAGSRLFFGAASGPSNQFVICRQSIDVVSTDDSESYGYNANCFADLSTTIVKRYAFVDFLTNGFRQNCLETNADSDKIYFMAIGGLQALVSSVTTRTDGADIPLTGAGFPPIGGLVASTGDPMSASDTPDSSNEEFWSFGVFDSASSRAAVGVSNDNGAALTANGTAVEHDAVYVKVNTAGTLAALMDVKSMEQDGVIFVMDDTEPTAGSFAGVILFGGEIVPRPSYRDFPKFLMRPGKP